MQNKERSMKPGLKQELESLKCQICGEKYCKFKDHSLRRADVFAKLDKTYAEIKKHPEDRLFFKWEVLKALDSERKVK